MRSRLPPEKLATLYVVVGAVFVIAMAWLFGEIAEDVINRDTFLATIDQEVATWLHERATPAITDVMIFVSYLGAPIATIVVGAVCAITLWLRRQRYAVLALVLALPCGMLLNVLVKYAVARPRPVFDEPILTLTSYSFPSGHAAGSTLLYGVLAAVFVSTVKGRRRQTLVVVAAVTFIVLIGFSRLYLGVHYLSDVVAGILAGIVWLSLCLFAVAALRGRRMRRRSD